MSEGYKVVKLQELTEREILNVCYDPAGQLVLWPSQETDGQLEGFQTDKPLPASSVRKLTVRQKAHLPSAYYGLKMYAPEPNASNLEKVRGYLEGFHHLCEVGDWRGAGEILCIRLDTPMNEELHNQLRTWGHYPEQLELYSRLLGKLNPLWDSVPCLSWKDAPLLPCSPAIHKRSRRT